jgi:hypothetical protein
MGILLGSLLSAVAGYLILRLAPRSPPRSSRPPAGIRPTSNPAAQAIDLAAKSDAAFKEKLVLDRRGP